MNSIPKVAVTPGEPAGIGPDLIIQLSQRDIPFQAELIEVGFPF